MSEIEHFLNQVERGTAAKGFLGSELGKYLLDNAQGDINECVAHLSDMEADRGEDDLMRQKIASRKLMFDWLVNAINEAEAANVRLIEAESED